MIDFDKILFRASCNGDIMTKGSELTENQVRKIDDYIVKAALKPLTENQRKEFNDLVYRRDNPELGDTCKKRLIQMYAAAMGREEEVYSKYMEKGTSVEEDAITLYSLVKEKFFKKNTQRLSNRFVTGEPDFFDGPNDNILDADGIIDTKAAWSLVTFLHAKDSQKAKKEYEWQGHTYLGLVPKAKWFKVAHILVNSPGFLIDDEKQKASWQLRVTSKESTDPNYVEVCKQIEKNHIFDMPLFQQQNPGYSFHNTEWREEWDIPKEHRIHEITIMRNEEAIDALYKKIPRCRRWMKETFGNGL